jgi:cytidine deaminase
MSPRPNGPICAPPRWPCASGPMRRTRAFSSGLPCWTKPDRIHAGCNVENAAYPQGLCAEAGAIAHLVAAGGRRIVAAVVVGEAPEPVTPCGGCRQKLREFAADDMTIRLAHAAGWRGGYTLGELLPASFGPAHLAGDPRHE